MSNDTLLQIPPKSVKIEQISNGYIVSYITEKQTSGGFKMEHAKHAFNSRRQMMNFIGKLFPDSKTSS